MRREAGDINAYIFYLSESNWIWFLLMWNNLLWPFWREIFHFYWCVRICCGLFEGKGDMENGESNLESRFAGLTMNDPYNINGNDGLFQVMKAVEAAEATIKQQVFCSHISFSYIICHIFWCCWNYEISLVQFIHWLLLCNCNKFQF